MGKDRIDKTLRDWTYEREIVIEKIISNKRENQLRGYNNLLALPPATLLQAKSR